MRLDSEEQAKIAKAGLDMKLASSEMEAEADKWRESEENNDIVKRAKNMSSMAFSMYQFTRGEGSLKTTQDLFTQAEYFAEEANRLYKVVRQFSYQVSHRPAVRASPIRPSPSSRAVQGHRRRQRGATPGSPQPPPHLRDSDKAT